MMRCLRACRRRIHRRAAGIRLLPWLLGTLALARPVVRADFVEFTNGNRLEGIIVEETATEVRMKVGAGTVTFPRSQLRAVSRDAAANAGLRQRWQEEHFAEPAFLPPDLHALAREFRELAGRQSAATAAQTEIGRLRNEVAQGDTTRERLEQRRAEVLALLPKLKNAGNPAAYNRLVLTNNDLVTQLAALQLRGRELETREATNRATVNAYLTSLLRVRNAVEAGRAQPGTNAATRLFFEKAGERIAALTAALEEFKLPMSDGAAGHAVAIARVNDRAEARLLVDTGASLVCFYAPAAARLGLRWDPALTRRAALADGREIEVHPITLESLTVAGARLPRVAAAVIATAPAGDVDGLLGMSFLREFDVQLDPARGQIFLRRLPPSR